MFHLVIITSYIGLISMMRIHYFLSVQCYAWTEYKFTCVCVCVSVTLSVYSPTVQVRPLNGLLQLID